MAVGNFIAYHQGLLEIAKQSADFEGGSIKAMLLLSSYEPVAAAHRCLSDISPDECADTDYVRQTVTLQAIALAGGKVRFDGADISFGTVSATVTITAKYLVLFVDTGVPETSTLLWYSDLNTSDPANSVSTVGSEFIISINASGIYELTP